MFAHSVSLVPIAAAAIAIVACRPGESARYGTTDSAATSAARTSAASTEDDANVVTVTAKDYSFDAPATIPSGLTTFRLVNRGPSLHHIQLVRLDSGKTVKDFVAALRAGGPPPSWAIMVGGPNPPQPGSSTNATVMLTPGKYAITCLVPAADGTPHIMKGMVRPLDVTLQRRANNSEPEADVTMRLVDYDFQLSRPLTPGKHTLRVENDGTQPHEVAIVRLATGKSPMDFAHWGEHPQGPEPGTMLGGVSGIMPGTHAFITVDLQPGEYGLICFLPDGGDGKPHFDHGMLKQIRVT